MTSPYLNRPVRPLRDVLRERGLSPNDVGMESAARRPPVMLDTNAERRPRKWFAAAATAAALFVLAAVVVYLEDMSNRADHLATMHLPSNLEAQAEILNRNVVPAAGGNGHNGQ